MGYRPSKLQARSIRDWKRFIQANRHTFENSGLPLVYYESQAMFEDFLMHGYIDHHFDNVGITQYDLEAEQELILKKLAIAYLRKYDDPGLMIFDPDERARLRIQAGLDK